MLMLVNSLALKIYSVTVLCTGPDKSRVSAGYIGITTSLSFGGAETSSGGASGTDNNVRVSYSSAASSSSYGSGDDFDSLGDVLVWSKGVGHSISAHASNISGNLHDSSSDVYSPKALESAFLLDIGSIACGSKRLVLVTKQGEIYSWGEELGGRLGHGVDVYHPKLISNPSGITIESVSCGDFHTCAVFFVGISTHGVMEHTILVFLVMGMILLIGFQRRFMAHWNVCTLHLYHVDHGVRLL
jgi:hypothetical protein